ncbi:MAG: hypothetical protein DDT42_01137 [candidate division WS2 bacterium]|uniref:Uncharacterized protein n=1 Tax=Psychracetigena formicireducens TaxID=2986056 RepID=A0A9E2BI25_PSYF1|nr:hypothetical protein [Candidatus Psychracetigena formicireducens]MBT9145267.1 hypothetical protein [Candidatus Psychracetigena formicireducens]
MKRKISKVVSVLLTVTLLVLVLVIPASASGDVGLGDHTSDRAEAYGVDLVLAASQENYDILIPLSETHGQRIISCTIIAILKHGSGRLVERTS